MDRLPIPIRWQGFRTIGTAYNLHASSTATGTFLLAPNWRESNSPTIL